MSEATDLVTTAYDGVECGECGDPIEYGEWCGNDDCVLGNDGPQMDRPDNDYDN